MLLAGLLMVAMACKKDVQGVPVDAFAQVNPKIVYKEGICSIQFTLEEYPYKEVGLRVATSKTLLHLNQGLTVEIANQVSANRYAVFFNTLLANKTYHYQIYVKDSASAKEVYSDVYSFTTNP